MSVEQFTPEHTLWQALVDHMQRVDMAQDVVNANGEPKDARVIFLGIREEERVIGHIAVRQQPILIPATEWSGGKDTPLSGPDGKILEEMFALTFAVDEDSRRRGYGRALQQAALELARSHGCTQLRSWVATDHPENHLLKIGLGFAMHPTVDEAADGTQVSGAYFVVTV